VWRKPKPSAFQLLWLPGVVKMEAADTRVTRVGCRGGSARMWSGMGAGTPHRAGWDVALHAACVGCRHGSSIRTDATFGAGMCAGRALGGHGSNVWTDAASGRLGASRSLTKIVEL
jgi:hypothetical protein